MNQPLVIITGASSGIGFDPVDCLINKAGMAAATKTAVKSLSESLQMANAKYGIRI